LTPTVVVAGERGRVRLDDLIGDEDLDVARLHALLLAHVHRSGRPRGAHDLVVAAAALARGRVVVTAERSGFSDLPGVAVRLVPKQAGKG
jgi:tRNA(fMet)-specific endonuclease VapC